jgi:hypothetical protein
MALQWPVAGPFIPVDDRGAISPLWDNESHPLPVPGQLVPWRENGAGEAEGESRTEWR